MEPLLLIVSLIVLVLAVLYGIKQLGGKGTSFDTFFGSGSGLTDFFSVLIAVSLIAIIIASRDPILVFLLLILLFRKVTYSPKIQTEFDYRSSMYSEGYTGSKNP